MKAIGAEIFRVSSGDRANPVATFQRVLARDLQLKESWFRDAIFDNPEIVIAPCREAGRVVDEDWFSWRVEENFGTGPVDVLLLSSRGRIGIVETKLSYNPQKRREVVAQVLDYALALQELDIDDLPAVPESVVATREDIEEAKAAGRFLLIIAGDAMDPRALRLSQSLLARHLTSEWDLAMIDLNLFRHGSSGELVLVPELLGLVQAEARQVVRITVAGSDTKARIEVQHLSEENYARARPSSLGSMEDFLAEAAKQAPQRAAAVRSVAQAFVRAQEQSGGQFYLELTATALHMYWATPTGRRRRILSIGVGGRMRVLFRYVEGDGYTELSAQLSELSRGVFQILASGQSAERMVESRDIEMLGTFVDRACQIFK